MTPVLAGRLQVRAVLIFLVAVPYTLLLGLTLSVPSWVLWIGLVLAILFGFFMDVVCNFIQKKRWDNDWPPLLFFIAGFVEFILLFESMKMLLPSDLFRGEIIHPFKPMYKYSGGRVLSGTDISSRLK